MKTSLFFILTALAGLGVRAASLAAPLEIGHEYYRASNFAKAATSFRHAFEADPESAVASYWTGMSYQRLADIAMPFGGRYNARAREYLTKAMKLQPYERLYRLALFDFLLDTAHCSRTALREAAAILRALPESDPDYPEMRRRFEGETNLNSSLNARLSRLFLAVPRLTYSIGDASLSRFQSKN
jgi:tetratricopeptide (TPR) repeat protein